MKSFNPKLKILHLFMYGWSESMTGKIKEFVTRVKECNQNIMTTRYFLHRESLISKYIGNTLQIVFQQIIYAVNFIKIRPKRIRIFSK